MASLSQASEFFAAAAKLKDLEDVDKELEDKRRLVTSATSDLRDARAAAVRVKSDADAYAAKKLAEAKALVAAAQREASSIHENNRARLQQMEDNTNSVVAAMGSKLEETRKAVISAKDELAQWQAKVGHVKSAFAEAHAAISTIPDEHHD